MQKIFPHVLRYPFFGELLEHCFSQFLDAGLDLESVFDDFSGDLDVEFVDGA